MEELSLVLDPQLGLGADEIVTAWNTDASLRLKAEAQRRQAAPDTFLDPMLAQGLVSLAVSVGGGLTTNLILDFIRARLKAKGKEPTVAIEQRELPTDERILVVRADKG